MFTTLLEYKVTRNRIITLKRNYETNRCLVLITTAENKRRERAIIHEEFHVYFRFAKLRFEKLKRGDWMQIEIDKLKVKKEKWEHEISMMNRIAEILLNHSLDHNCDNDEEIEFLNKKNLERRKYIENLKGEIEILERTGDKND